MSAVVRQLLIVDPANPNAVQPYQGLHAVSPVLIGLGAPFLALLLLMPRTFASLGVAGPAVLLLVMLAAAAILIHGVFTAGRIAALAFRPDARMLDIIETGLFSRRVTSLRFDEVAGLRVSPHYDRDGYGYATTELVMRNGETLFVPLQPTSEQLAAVRQMLARA